MRLIRPFLVKTKLAFLFKRTLIGSHGNSIPRTIGILTACKSHKIPTEIVIVFNEPLESMEPIMGYLNKLVIIMTMLFVISSGATDERREQIRRAAEVSTAMADIQSDSMLELLEDDRFNPLFEEHEKNVESLKLIGAIASGTGGFDDRPADIENLAQALQVVLKKYPESKAAESFVKSVLRVLSRTDASEITNHYLMGAVEIAKSTTSKSLAELKEKFDGNDEATLRDLYFQEQSRMAEESIENAERNVSSYPEAKLNSFHLYLVANKDNVKSALFITGLVKDLLRGSHDNALNLLGSLISEKNFNFLKKVLTIELENISSKSDRFAYEIRTKLKQCLYDPRIMAACVGIVLAFAQGSIAFAAISVFMIFSDRILASHGDKIAKGAFKASSYLAMIAPYMGTLITNIRGGLGALKEMDAESIEKAIKENVTDNNLESYLKKTYTNIQEMGSELSTKAQEQGGAFLGNLSAGAARLRTQISEGSALLGQMAEERIRAAGGGDMIDKLKATLNELIAQIPDAKLLEQMRKEFGDSFSVLMDEFVDKRTDGVEEPGEPRTLLSFAALRDKARAVSANITSGLSTMTSGGQDAITEFDIIIRRSMGTMTCGDEFGAL